MKTKKPTKKKSRTIPVDGPVRLNVVDPKVKVPEGRPLKFATSQDLIAKANQYFRSVMKKKKEPITLTGLCMALGTFRDVLMDYQNGVYDKRDPEFSNAVKGIKQMCENYAERMLFIKGNPAGPIFALKNYRWTDTQQVESKKTFDVTGLEELDDAQLEEFIKGIQARVGKGAH
jgi:hypothetical protein